MKNHLKLVHPDEFNSLIKEDSAATVPAATRSMALAVPSTSSSSVSTKKQITVTESFEKKMLWDVNDAKAKKYHYSVAEMIALDNEPLSMVERTGFIRLLQHAAPRYKLSSRTYIP